MLPSPPWEQKAKRILWEFYPYESGILYTKFTIFHQNCNAIIACKSNIILHTTKMRKKKKPRELNFDTSWENVHLKRGNTKV